MIDQSYQHCRDVTRRRAGNFYAGIRLFPEDKRAAICALYAWSRAGDDLADAERPEDDRARSVAAFADQTRSTLDDPADAERLGAHWPAFVDTCARFPIERSAIDDMLAGLLQDTRPVALETWADLDQYCDRVASSVGRMCVSVWGPATGVDAGSMREPAIMRGRAFQLVNILRDVAEDHDAEPTRVYLPAEVFADAGITPEQLRAWAEPGRCRRLIEQVAARAQQRFDRSAGLETMVHPSCVPGLVAMTRVYRGILVRIEREPAAVVGTRRVSLPPWSKTGIALRAAASRIASGVVGVGRP
ncbi:MAG: phytoene/squalene synthase family protein [Planctomycetota bacterium]